MTRSVLRASDAEAWTSCRRRFWFDHHPPAEPKTELDEFSVLIRQRGIEHEQRVRAHLGGGVPGVNAERTRELMAKGEGLIYQAVLESAELGLMGRPDFLRRTEQGTYKIADAKLASSLDGHPEIVLQLGVYRMLLGNGEPAEAHLGNLEVALVGSESETAVRDFVRDAQHSLASAVRPQATYAFSRCEACPYINSCMPEFKNAGDVTLLPGIDQRKASFLTAQGIANVGQLARQDPNSSLGSNFPGREAAWEAAVMQAKAVDGGIVVARGSPSLPAGTWIHFDIEDDPHGEAQPAVYLWGFLEPPYEKENYTAVWSGGNFESTWREFLARVAAFRQKWPEVRLIHYSHHERTKIRACAAAYGTEGDPTSTWLQSGEALFDLCAAVKEACFLPVRGYGLKEISKQLHLYTWEQAESGSQWSVVRWNEYLKTTDPARRAEIKAELLTYNRGDVQASRAAEVWLRSNLASRRTRPH